MNVGCGFAHMILVVLLVVLVVTVLLLVVVVMVPLMVVVVVASLIVVVVVIVVVVGNYICRGRGRWQCFGQGPLGSERHQMAGQMVEKQKAKLGCKF